MRIGYDRFKTEEYGEKFGAVIMAAGYSSRMNDFKPLLSVNGRSAIEGLIETAKAAGIHDISVVTGHNREALEEIIREQGVGEAYNEEYAEGMFSSVKAGLKKTLDGESGISDGIVKSGVFLMPVDCPLISVSTLRKMMAEISGNSESDFAVATFRGKKGHPLYVPLDKASEILEYEGDGGLAGITDRYEITRIETGEEGCILDMDTPEDYEDIRAFVAKGFAREKLELLTARKRIFLVRHGETEQHNEPMFIGQYDVSLNNDGRIRAEEVGRQIAELMLEDVEAEAMGMDKFGKEPLPAIERIYSSDLKRARETAEIIKEKINRILPEPVEVQYHKGLREINLGPWDGKPVSEIKSTWPEEYENRGRNMMTFKMRGAENFFDLQYRTVETLREILRNDDAKDIIIVTHNGVVRALENNINGGAIEDAWEPLEKGGFRMLEPFPLQPSEKVHGDKPMNMNDLTMDAVLEYYE